MGFLSKIFGANPESEKRNKFQEIERQFVGDIEMTNLAKAGWLTSMGNNFAIQHRLDQAIECFKDAIKFSPNKVSAYISLGMAYVEKNMFKEAIDILERADVLERNPKESNVLKDKPYLLDISNQNLHHALGMAYMKIGDKEKATHHFEKSLKAAEALKNAERGRIIKGQDAMNMMYIMETTRQFLKQLRQD